MAGESSTSIAAQIAIIVVNFNGGDDVIRCLRGLSRQTVTPGKTIVIDNHSHDGSPQQIMKHFPEAHFVGNQANLGFAAANNQAIDLCPDSKWIALLNPDAWPDPDWLEQLIAAIQAHPNTRIFSSRMIDANDQTKLDGSGDIYHVSGLSWRRDHGASSATVRSSDESIFSPCAAAAIYNRQAVENAGRFDECYFCYNEDIDLAFRMRLNGERCRYINESVVHHVGSGVTGKNSDFSIYHGHRNLVWTYFKNMPTAMLWLYLPQHILLNLITIVYFMAQGKTRIILKSKWHALKGIPQMLRSRKEIHGQAVASSADLKRAMSRGWLKPYVSRYV